MRNQRVIGVLLLVMCGTSMVCAQEMNYNTFQVGSRSTLMGGAVVGGVRDTTATFYNPAALGFVDNSSISVSANAFRLGQVTMNDALGPGEDATTTLLDPIPLLVSGMLRFQSAPDWGFGYAVVTRQQYSGTFTNAVNAMRETINVEGGVLPLPAQVIAQSNISSQSSDYWAIGAVSWRINDTLALGVAPIVALRRQSRIQRFSIQTLLREGGEGSLPIGVNTITDVNFYQLSFLARLGIAWEPRPLLKLGATVTTPNLKIASSGSSLAQTTLTNIPTSNDLINRFGSDFQDSLSVHYRTPLSMAVGTEIQPWAPFTFGLSVEYSTALGRTALLEVRRGRPFFRGPGTEGSGDSVPFLTPLDERRAVVNVAFGAEYTFTDVYAAYLGFWTDFSPLDSQQSRDIALSGQGFVLPTGDIDLYHVVLGATRTTRRSKFAAGVVFSHGTGTVQSEIDVTATGNILGLTPGGRLSERNVSFDSLSLVLGYTYFF